MITSLERLVQKSFLLCMGLLVALGFVLMGSCTGTLAIAAEVQENWVPVKYTSPDGKRTELTILNTPGTSSAVITSGGRRTFASRRTVFIYLSNTLDGSDTVATPTSATFLLQARPDSSKAFVNATTMTATYFPIMFQSVAAYREWRFQYVSQSGGDLRNGYQAIVIEVP